MVLGIVNVIVAEYSVNKVELHPIHTSAAAAAAVCLFVCLFPFPLMVTPLPWLLPRTARNCLSDLPFYCCLARFLFHSGATAHPGSAEGPERRRPVQDPHRAQEQPHPPASGDHEDRGGACVCDTRRDEGRVCVQTVARQKF